MSRCRPIRSLMNQVRSFASKSTASPVDRAVRAVVEPMTQRISREFCVEALESRRLLTTISGSGTLEYKDGGGDTVRLVYHNVTAELVFARVVGRTAVLGDLIPPSLPKTATKGKDLFHVYVAESSVDSYMTIARVPDLNTDGNPRPMRPFTGSVGIRHQDLNTNDSVVTSAGPGDILLGAQTPSDVPNNGNNIPIVNQRFDGLGILGARPNGRLNAGITVAPGQDFGRFYFGGTILGQVTFQGSIDQFYAGALLTGDPTGSSTVSDNFYVAGDIRDLWVGGSAGGISGRSLVEPSYLTNVQVTVHGTIGQVHATEDWFGNVVALHESTAPGLRLRQHEIEYRIDPSLNRGSATNFQGTDSPDGLPHLGDNSGQFSNDTFATAQYLGVFNSRIVGENGIHVNGTLQGTERIQDRVDYYGVALMGGQNITVRLVTAVSDISDIAFMNVGVFDPDGRLIATDYQDTSSDDFVAGKAFTINADRPGVYRIAVAIDRDFNFDGDTVDTADGEPGPQNNISPTDYQIQVTGAGNVSFGALYASGNIYDATDYLDFVTSTDDLTSLPPQRASIMAQNGDLGALNAGGAIVSSNSYGAVGATGGNLRSLDASSLGFQDGSSFIAGPTLFVPDGSIGLIRATGVGAATTLFVDMAFTFDGGFNNGPTDSSDVTGLVAVGGDIQIVSAADEFEGNLVVNKAIGTIRAREMTAGPAPRIAVNADGLGSDGVIDLIDVSGDFGSLAAGGPQISTGPGGNVRYIRVGGNVYRDNFFGRGSTELQVFDAGQKATFIDDSGSRLLITPIPLTRSISFTTGSTSFVNPGTLTAQYYPIRGSGGGVLISVTSTRGVQVDVSGGSAEIGRIDANGTGAGVITQSTNVFGNAVQDDKLVLDPNSTEDLSVLLNGSGVIDVLTIKGNNFNRILNRSSGEIVNVNAGSIGTIAGKTLGIAKHATASAVIPNVIDYGLANATLGIVGGIGNTYPLTDERTGIVASGDVVTAQSNNGIGNFLVAGTIQQIIANSDRKFTSGVFEGLDGNVLAGREIRFVDIGEGLAFSGTGNVSHAGIYADGRIVKVVNQGLASDIHGDIVSRGQSIAINNPNTGRADPSRSGGIVSIQLTNGSILDADIYVATDYQTAREFGQGLLLPDAGGITTDPVYEIGNITLNGIGGIMNSDFEASDIGTVQVIGGFGIMQTDFGTPAQGTISNITADGFGIRSSNISGGGSLNKLNARGKGNRLSTLGFSPTSRYSEKKKFDPYTGRSLTALNDLHMYLGTSATEPVRTKGSRSVGGLIDHVTATGGRTAGTISGYRIYTSAFAYGNGIGSITATDAIDTINVVAGRLDLLKTGGDMDRSTFTVAGPTGTVAIGGTYRGTNEFIATGPDGYINIFATKRSLFGAVRAQKGIGEIRVGTDIGSPSIESTGNINAIRVNGNILSGAYIRTAKTLLNLVVTGDVQDGAIIQARDILNQSIGGDVFGDIQII